MDRAAPEELSQGFLAQDRGKRLLGPSKELRWKLRLGHAVSLERPVTTRQEDTLNQAQARGAGLLM